MYRLYYPRDMNFNGNDPVFLQLAHNMEHLIEAGAYPLDEPLPSVREIAFAEKINPGTVARAYSIMVDDGYVVSIPKKGYFIAKKDEATDEVASVLALLIRQGHTKEEIASVLQGLDESGDAK